MRMPIACSTARFWASSIAASRAMSRALPWMAATPSAVTIFDSCARAARDDAAMNKNTREKNFPYRIMIGTSCKSEAIEQIYQRQGARSTYKVEKYFTAKTQRTPGRAKDSSRFKKRIKIFFATFAPLRFQRFGSGLSRYHDDSRGLSRVKETNFLDILKER